MKTRYYKRERIVTGATVIIAAMAVVGYVGTSRQFTKTLQQSDKQFELMNRPFIKIWSPTVQVVNKNLLNGDLPSLRFYISIDLINRGRMPAYVKMVECIINLLTLLS